MKFGIFYNQICNQTIVTYTETILQNIILKDKIILLGIRSNGITGNIYIRYKNSVYII